MQTITFHDKALAHLNRFRHIRQDIEYGAPFEITQDGIAVSLGITRSHASIILKRMAEKGEVEWGESTVKKSNSSKKRKVYFLTEIGKGVYEQMKENMASDGIAVDELKMVLNQAAYDDIKRVAGEKMDMIGMMCVIRFAILKKDVDTNQPLIGFSRTGEAFVVGRIKDSILSGCSDEEFRRWHSVAADWCIDHDLPMSERLYHLVQSNRDREAELIIASNRYQLIDTCGKDLLMTVNELAMRRDDADIFNIAVRMALDLDDLQTARRLSERLIRLDVHLGRTALSELSLKEKRLDEALDLARGNYLGDVDSGIVLGRCLLESDLLKEASDCFGRIMESMLREGCIFRMDELMMYEARTEMRLHNTARAQDLISAAMSITKNDRIKADLAELGQMVSLRSEDCVLLQ